jgi:hypothetical protein
VPDVDPDAPDAVLPPVPPPEFALADAPPELLLPPRDSLTFDTVTLTDATPDCAADDDDELVVAVEPEVTDPT